MNVYDLYAKITLDQSEYDKGLEDSEKKAHGLGDRLKGGLKTAGKVGAAAIGAATAAVGAASGAVGMFMKQSIDSYAEYEQLVGGAQLMYGDAYDFIAEKAQNAYKTVQMSQNDYLQQANGFATGLKTALGGNERAAAELADKILTAEADIVAATGNSQEAVQNAFNGIMKSNYTMLDNLQIGITPTKEGMQEVIDKVNEWNAANGNASNYVIDNLADVQSALVDYIQMQGLAGYAANEASETISGSMASLKASWENLLTGLSDGDADLSELVDNLVESAETVIENILPIAEKALEGIGTLIEEIAPVVEEKLPGLIETVLPSLLDAATSLITGIVDALPTLIQVLAEQAPTIIGQIVTAITENLPLLVDAALHVILALANGLIENLPQLIPSVVDVMLGIVDGLIDHLGELVTAAIEIMIALGAGLIDALPELVKRLPEIFQKAKDELANMDWASIGKDFMSGIGNGVMEKAKDLADKVLGAVKGAWDTVTGWLGIHSPSKLAEKEIGVNWAKGIGVGFVRDMPKEGLIMADAVSDAFNGLLGDGIGFDGSESVGGTFAPVINVYGAQGQDVNDLADIVMDKMTRELKRRRGSYAIA